MCKKEKSPLEILNIIQIILIGPTVLDFNNSFILPRNIGQESSEVKIRSQLKSIKDS